MTDVQQPQGQQQGQAQGQPQGQAQQQPAQEPAWLSQLPEQYRKEARDGYLMQADYTKKTTELADQRKAWEAERGKLQEVAKNYDQVMNWYQTQYLPFYQRIQPRWNDIEQVLNGNGQAQAAAAAAPANSQPDPFRDWDLLPANEQAKRLADYVRASSVDPTVQQLARLYQTDIAQRERQMAGFIQRYNAIYADAIQKALQEYKQGRDFPIQDYVAERLRITAGQIDDADLAYKKVTGDYRQKDLEKQWYERGKKDREQEFVNQQQNPGALQNASVPIFRQQPKSREEIAALNRKIAAEKGIPW